MNKTRAAHGVLAAGALLAVGTAQAEISTTVTLTSDYNFRGISQTAQDPALQIGVDWAHESGFYLGAWGSNVDFDGGEGFESDSNVEVDLIAGYSGSITEDLGYDLGVTYYAYLPSGDRINYVELYAGLSQGIFSGMVWYAPDYGNSGESAWYTEANAGIPLPWELSLNLHVGYSFGDYWKEDSDEFYDYSVGIGRSFGNFDFEVKWADGSDNSAYDPAIVGQDVLSSEGQVIFTVSTTFPWGRE
jgi:uncharacterized protein (TIGR02001 family)